MTHGRVKYGTILNFLNTVTVKFQLPVSEEEGILVGLVRVEPGLAKEVRLGFKGEVGDFEAGGEELRVAVKGLVTKEGRCKEEKSKGFQTSGIAGWVAETKEARKRD